MKYDVKEKKYYNIEGINKITNYDYYFEHVETTFDLEKYQIVLEITYENNFDKLEEKEIVIPVDFTTSMTEQLEAIVKDINVFVDDGKGIVIEMNVEINVESIEEDKQEIKEIYQQELVEKLSEREEIVEIVEEEPINKILESAEKIEYSLLDNLNNEFVKYKIINLDENSLDKISVKYNLSMEYLYNAKKNSGKIIVYDKE